MKKFLFLLIIPINALFAQEQVIDYKPRAEKVYNDIRSGNFAGATADFDTSVANRIDSAKLRKVWENIIKMAGPFVKIIEVNADHQPNYDVIIQKGQFEKKKVDFKIVYGTNQKIKGISFLPGEPKEQYKLPPYNKPDEIAERNIVVQNGPFRLPGIITTPKKPGRYPLVVLIHGSGPNDKDETVGATKIFKDLAIGLAANGVAVFRYDKRSRIYAAKFSKDKSVTVKEETIDDAMAVARFLKTDSMVDSTSIYLCGHSLGGMLLPRIVTPDIKGLIYLAANARPLAEMLYEQTIYVLSLDSSGKDRTALIDSVKKEVDKIKLINKASKDTTFHFRIPAGYWADLNSYDQVKSAKSINKPMLFLQGGRDYQVTETDYNIWKKELTNGNAHFVLYPDMNHFFMKGEGKSSPSEYIKAANVDISVINDISAWILGPKK